jgi:hypothetical protein
MRAPAVQRPVPMLVSLASRDCWVWTIIVALGFVSGGGSLTQFCFGCGQSTRT